MPPIPIVCEVVIKVADVCGGTGSPTGHGLGAQEDPNRFSSLVVVARGWTGSGAGDVDYLRLVRSAFSSKDHELAIVVLWAVC